MKTSPLFLVLIGLLIGVTSWGAAPARAELPPLIPRSVLFSNPERLAPRLAADGSFFAYLAPDAQAVMQIWIRSLDKDDDRMITSVTGRNIMSFSLANDNTTILYRQDTNGDEAWRLYAVDIESKTVRNLTPPPYTRVKNIFLADDEVLAEVFGKARAHDILRINIHDGSYRRELALPSGTTDWQADTDGLVRAITILQRNGSGTLFVRTEDGGQWEAVYSWNAEDYITLGGFTRDGKSLYFKTTKGADTACWISLDLATRVETVLAKDAEYDCQGAVFAPDGSIRGILIPKERLEFRILDHAIDDDYRMLLKLHEGECVFRSRDRTDRRWIVSYTTDCGPTDYYLFNRDTKDCLLLFSDNRKLDDLALAPMKPVSFPARDGLVIHGYLTTPVGIPATALPTVLLVHGGPWNRNTWGYHAEVQWLANRGYAVLQINYRGSSGYGKKFLTAGNREWGGKMQDDLTDSARWLITQGIADPKKVAIYGASYGGFATLAGLAFTPDLFVAGVDICGPSNLVSFMRNNPSFATPQGMSLALAIGDVRKDAKRLRAHSPYYFVQQITAPLLIAQGANDPRVPQAESDQIATALRKAGKSVEYLLYTDEGHGITRQDNRLHFFARTETFLAKYLGGRAEPAEEITGHSAVVK